MTVDYARFRRAVAPQLRELADEQAQRVSAWLAAPVPDPEEALLAYRALEHSHRQDPGPEHTGDVQALAAALTCWGPSKDAYWTVIARSAWRS
jgi:hypothetical protein